MMPPTKIFDVARFATILAIFVQLLDLREQGVRQVKAFALPLDEATIPTPTALRALSLGHTEAAAKILWVSGLVYFGESISTRSAQRYLQRYADTIEDLDPNFRAAYRWGSIVSVYNSKVITQESIRNSLRHLERGLRVFPDDGEMTYEVGFNCFFEMPQLLAPGPERTQWKRRGAESLRRAAALGYGPSWMAFAAANALETSGLVDAAVEHLHGLYLATDDAERRARIEEQIARLRANQADPFLDAVRSFERERQSSFPYVPPLVHLFTGPGVAEIVGLRN